MDNRYPIWDEVTKRKLAADSADVYLLDCHDSVLAVTELSNLAELLDSNTQLGRVLWAEEQTELAFIDEHITPKLKQNQERYQRFPSDYELAVLSHHSYSDHSPGAKVTTTVHAGSTTEKQHSLEGWRVLEVHKDHKSGFDAVLSINDSKKQLVLAFRGTQVDLNSWDGIKATIADISTDIKGIIKQKLVKQHELSFCVTKAVVALIKTDYPGYRLAITGHSLGGWLAQLASFHAVKQFGFFESKTVTFDSPGVKSTLVKLSGQHEFSQERYKKLPIVNYFSMPNPVNSCNAHVGTSFRVYPDIPQLGWFISGIRNFSGNLEEQVNAMAKNSSLNDVAKFLLGPAVAKVNDYTGKVSNLITDLEAVSGHGLDSIVDQFDPQNGRPKKCDQIVNWPQTKFPAAKKTAVTPTQNVISWTIQKLSGLVVNQQPDLKTIQSAIAPFVRANAFDDIAGVLECWVLGKVSTGYRVFYDFGNSANKFTPDLAALSSKDQFALVAKGQYETKAIATSTIALTELPRAHAATLRNIELCGPSCQESPDIDSDTLTAIQQLYKIDFRSDPNTEMLIADTSVSIDELLVRLNTLLRFYPQHRYAAKISGAHNRLKILTPDQATAEQIEFNPGKVLDIHKETYAADDRIAERDDDYYIPETFDNYYPVGLTEVTTKPSNGKPQESKPEIITAEQLFNYGNPQAQRIEISAPAGMGKTSLARWLRYRWANADIWPKISWLIHIPLRELLDQQKFPKPKAGLKYKAIDLLMAFLPEELQRCDPSTVQQYFKQQNIEAKVLIIFDGLDEVVDALDHQLKYLKEALLELAKYNRSIYISRPNYQLPIKTNEKFELSGFSDETTFRYIDNYFAAKSSTNHADQLKVAITKNPALQELAQNPLHLKILCNIWSDGTAFSTEITESAIYLKLMVYNVRRYLRRYHGLNTDLTDYQVLTHLSVAKAIRFISAAAYQAVSDGQQVLWHSNLIATAKTAEVPASDLKNIIAQLKRIGIVSTHGKQLNLYFVHPSFRDFMSGYHIAQLFAANTSIAREITANKYNQSYRAVWRYSAGIFALLYADTQRSAEFLELFEDHANDLLGFEHRKLMLELGEETAYDLLDQQVLGLRTYAQQLLTRASGLDFDQTTIKVVQDGYGHDRNLIEFLARLNIGKYKLGLTEWFAKNADKLGTPRLINLLEELQLRSSDVDDLLLDRLKELPPKPLEKAQYITRALVGEQFGIKIFANRMGHRHFYLFSSRALNLEAGDLSNILLNAKTKANRPRLAEFLAQYSLFNSVESALKMLDVLIKRMDLDYARAIIAEVLFVNDLLTSDLKEDIFNRTLSCNPTSIYNYLGKVRRSNINAEFVLYLYGKWHSTSDPKTRSVCKTLLASCASTSPLAFTQLSGILSEELISPQLNEAINGVADPAPVEIGQVRKMMLAINPTNSEAVCDMAFRYLKSKYITRDIKVFLINFLFDIIFLPNFEPQRIGKLTLKQETIPHRDSFRLAHLRDELLQVLTKMYIAAKSETLRLVALIKLENLGLDYPELIEIFNKVLNQDNSNKVILASAIALVKAGQPSPKSIEVIIKAIQQKLEPNQPLKPFVSKAFEAVIASKTNTTELISALKDLLKRNNQISFLAAVTLVELGDRTIEAGAIVNNMDIRYGAKNISKMLVALKHLGMPTSELIVELQKVLSDLLKFSPGTAQERQEYQKCMSVLLPELIELGASAEIVNKQIIQELSMPRYSRIAVAIIMHYESSPAPRAVLDPFYQKLVTAPQANDQKEFYNACYVMLKLEHNPKKLFDTINICLNKSLQIHPFIRIELIPAINRLVTHPEFSNILVATDFTATCQMLALQAYMQSTPLYIWDNRVYLHSSSSGLLGLKLTPEQIEQLTKFIADSGYSFDNGDFEFQIGIEDGSGYTTQISGSSLGVTAAQASAANKLLPPLAIFGRFIAATGTLLNGMGNRLIGALPLTTAPLGTATHSAGTALEVLRAPSPETDYQCQITVVNHGDGTQTPSLTCTGADYGVTVVPKVLYSDASEVATSTFRSEASIITGDTYDPATCRMASGAVVCDGEKTQATFRAQTQTPWVLGPQLGGNIMLGSLILHLIAKILPWNNTKKARRPALTSLSGPDMQSYRDRAQDLQHQLTRAGLNLAALKPNIHPQNYIWSQRFIADYQEDLDKLIALLNRRQMAVPEDWELLSEEIHELSSTLQQELQPEPSFTSDPDEAPLMLTEPTTYAPLLEAAAFVPPLLTTSGNGTQPVAALPKPQHGGF